MRRTTLIAAVAAGVLAMTGAPALAHQTASNAGATVTMHVSPDDEPVAGQAATINVVSVKVPTGGRFSFTGSRVRVTDSSGGVVLDRAGAKHVSITFPRSAAYQITFSGRYRLKGRLKNFTTTFAIRAD